MKIAFGMIVFEGDYVLRQCLEQVYQFASQILIAEGPVKYWQDQGRTTSTDKTNEILDNFPDPDNKITVVHGQYNEKDDQCRAYMDHVNDDIDYIWNLDSDEVYKTKDLEIMTHFLEVEKPTSVGVRSCSFYGGFDHYLTGFELAKDNFLRIFKYEKGSTWKTHRPPTIEYPPESNIVKHHVSSERLFRLTGVQMYHYSYVFPTQVQKKIGYYKECVSKHNCIDNYYEKIYIPWIFAGDPGDEERKTIEDCYRGVHEFKPQARGDCFTEKFLRDHPESIQNSMEELQARFDKEKQEYLC